MLIHQEKHKKIKITTSEDIYKILQELYNELEEFEKDKERFYVIGLSRRNTIRYIDLVSIGSMTGTVAEPREIFRMAIHKGVGGGIIMAHNHPSGNVNPSEADIRLTKRIKEAGKILEIYLVDHVVFSEEGHYSFTNEGML